MSERSNHPEERKRKELRAVGLENLHLTPIQKRRAEAWQGGLTRRQIAEREVMEHGRGSTRSVNNSLKEVRRKAVQVVGEKPEVADRYRRYSESQIMRDIFKI